MCIVGGTPKTPVMRELYFFIFRSFHIKFEYSYLLEMLVFYGHFFLPLLNNSSYSRDSSPEHTQKISHHVLTLMSFQK